MTFPTLGIPTLEQTACMGPFAYFLHGALQNFCGQKRTSGHGWGNQWQEAF